MRMKPTVDQAVSITFAVCAVVVVGVMVSREFREGSAPVQAPQPESPTSFLQGWETEAAKGIRIGPQGKFPSYYQILFDKQDSLGLLPWRRLAESAGAAGTRREI